MLRQQHHLVYVPCIVQQLPCDRLQHRVLPPGDEYLAREILRFEWSDGLKDAIPALFPPAHHLGASGAGLDLEFAIAVPVRFLPIAGQKIRPAGAHVAGHMLDEHGNAVGFRIDQTKYFFICNLRERFFGELLITSEIP